MNNKKTLLALSMCCLSYVAQASENELAPVHQVAKTTFDKLLDVSPNDADEYVQLQRDVKELTQALIKVKQQHGVNINALSEHQQAKDNEYNRDQKFMLFRQLDNQDYKKQINASGYTLSRVRQKLHIASNKLQLLRLKVNDLYAAKYQVADKSLIDNLLAGDIVSLSIPQQKLVVQYLIEQQDNPQQVVALLTHPNVAQMLPDYLKEQLKVFEDSNIRLLDALSNKQVMAAVVDKLKAIDFLEEQQVAQALGPIYAIDQGQDIINGAGAPIKLSNHLSQNDVNPLTAVELYDIPIPSKELVKAINGTSNTLLKRSASNNTIKRK